MKKLMLLSFFIILLIKPTVAQILCVQCFDQNDSISNGVQNLILNGGFENATNTFTGSFCPNSIYYGFDLINWTCTGGGDSTYAHIFNNVTSTIVQGNKAAYFGNYLCSVCSNVADDTSCLNSLNCTVGNLPSGYPVNPNTGYGGTAGISLSQTVSGLIIGNVYVLEFWAGGESDFGQFTSNSVFAVNVGFGDTLLRENITPATTGIGKRYIIEFKAVSTSHTIKFTNWGHICTVCTELVLDDVRLYTLAQLDNSVPHCTTVGIKEIIKEEEINIHPNPFTSQTTITFSEEQKNTIIYIRDVLGQIVNSQQVSGSSATIDMSGVSKGIYFVQIQTTPSASLREPVIVNRKIVVE